METLRTHEVAVGRLRPAERDDFLALLNRAFGRQPVSGLWRDFPSALAAENQNHQFVLRAGSSIAAAAAAVVRPWWTSEGRLTGAGLGCFATDPDCRGLGYSTRLQEAMLRTLGTEGVRLAVLWTDQPEIYRGRGFAPMGWETHARLESLSPPELRPGERIRHAKARDAPELLELYHRHALRVERSVGDMQRHLDPRVSKVLLLERHGQILAYAAAGKGEDFRGYILDYGGPVREVHVLWGRLGQDGAEHVLVPEGAERYLTGAALELPRRQQAAAEGMWLDAEAPRGGRPRLRWAVWGFDSA